MERDILLGIISKCKKIKNAVNGFGSDLAGKADVLKGNIEASGTKALTIKKPCLVVASRASAGTHTTTALVDQWGGIVYIDDDGPATLSVEDSTLTITNTDEGYINYLVLS